MLNKIFSALRSVRFPLRFTNATQGAVLLAASLALLGGSVAQAASGTWTATGNGDFSTPGNWLGATVPNSGGIATFGSSGGSVTPRVVNITGGVQIKGITFNGDASAYTITANSGQFLIIESGGVIQTTGEGLHSESFTTEIRHSGPATFTSDYADASNVLNFSGPIKGNLNVAPGSYNLLTLNGSNKGANTISGAISNSVGVTTLTKSGVGTWKLSGVNTYTGPTQVTGGFLMVSGTHTGGGDYTVNGGALGGAGGKISASKITVSGAPGSGINVSGAGLGTTGLQNAMSGPGVLELALTSSLDISLVGEQSLSFVLAAPGTSDQVKLSSGKLNIGTGVLNLAAFKFDISNWSATGAEGTYILFATSSPTGITGSLATDGLTGTLGNYNVELAIGTSGGGAQELRLNVTIPEPSTSIVMMIGLLVFITVGIQRWRGQAGPVNR